MLTVLVIVLHLGDGVFTGLPVHCIGMEFRFRAFAVECKLLCAGHLAFAGIGYVDALHVIVLKVGLILLDGRTGIGCIHLILVVRHVSNQIEADVATRCGVYSKFQFGQVARHDFEVVVALWVGLEQFIRLFLARFY